MVHQQFTRVFDLLDAYKTFKKEDLFCLKRNDEWKKYSVDETLETIQTLALGLLELKIKPGEKWRSFLVIVQHGILLILPYKS